MATVSILKFALIPAGAATRICHESRPIGRLGIFRTVTPFFGDNGTPLPLSGESRGATGRERAVGRTLGFFGFVQGRSGLRVKAEENDNGQPQVDDNKPFYAAAEFWIQVAVVILTFGFVDAGYSGDWSRIGALSLESEAQLRTAAFVVVPLSAALIWVIGNRKNTQS